MQTTTRLTFVFALVSLLSTLLLFSFAVNGCQNDSECNYPFYDNVLNETMNGVNLMCLNGTCGCDGSLSYYYNDTFCAPLCSNNNECGQGVCNMTNGMCECNPGFDGVHCEQSLGNNNNNNSNPPPGPVDPCANLQCGNGTCKNGTCECHNGFTGPNCDQVVNPPPGPGNNGTNPGNNGSNPNPQPNPNPGNNGTNPNNGSNPNPPPPNPNNNGTDAPGNNGTNPNNGSNPNPPPGPVDPCKDVKCANGACVNGTCNCQPGFVGPRCDQPVGPNPNNNGTQPNNGTNNNNGSNPNPPPGPVDPCKDVKCANGACVNGTCNCQPGFVGPQCDQPVNPNPNNNGNNTNNNNGSNPNPPPPGPVDPCKDVKCANGACVNGTCKCNPGFVGPQCDQPVGPNPNNNGTNNNNGTQPTDPCQGVVCKNGMCAAGVCKCSPFYRGDKCEVLLPPPPPSVCGNVNCTGYSTCDAGNCVCYFGFSPPSCLGPDPCSGVKCGVNQHCFDGGCVCNAGFTGPKCDTPINNNNNNTNPQTCLDVVCPPNQMCKGGACVCNSGYVGANCTEFIQPKCEMIMSADVTPFCFATNKYPIINTILIPGMQSKDQYAKFIVDKAKSLDAGAQNSMMALQMANPSCTSGECMNILKTVACFSAFMPCMDDNVAQPCQSYCYNLLNNPQLSQQFISSMSCANLPTSHCYGATNDTSCANVKCGNNQHCIGGACICNEGFGGVNCDVPVNNNNTQGCNCGNNQHCDNNVCVCNDGWIGATCSELIPPKCENVMSADVTPFCSSVGEFPVFSNALIGGLPSKDQYAKYIIERAKLLDGLAQSRVQDGLTMNPKCVSQSCKTTLKKIACLMSFPSCVNNLPQSPCQSYCKSLVSDPELNPVFVSKLDCSQLPNANCFMGANGGNSTNPNAPVDLCQGNTCSDHGSCLKESGVCKCFNEFYGEKCENQIIKCGGFLSTDKNVCSGRGSCTGSDKCECKSGYKGKNCEDADCSSAPCKNGGQCYAPNTCKCPNGFGEADCSVFIPIPGCISPMNPQDTPFCSSVGVSHPLYNMNYLPPKASASNKTDFEAKIKSVVRDMDKNVQTEALAMLKNYPGCTTEKCMTQIKRLVCYNQFKVCVSATQNSASLCKGACETLVDTAGADSLNTTKDAFCGNFNTTGCTAGVFIADTTTCFGKNIKSGSVCNGNGKCIGQDQCSCFFGYGGSECNVPTCFGKSQDDASACGGKGKCIAPNTCNCKAGYSGVECDIKTCNGKTEQAGGCSFNGKCTDVDVCQCRGNFDPSTFCLKCLAGYTGPNCEIPICFNTPATDRSVCNGKGSCQGPNACNCLAGFSGSSCQTYSCHGIEKSSPSVCSQHGKCVGPDTCQCDPAWTGSRNCSSCSPAFKGATCQEQTCTDEGTCGGKGKCQGLKCVCTGNYAGEYCEKCIGGFVGANCSISCNPSTCNGRGMCNDDGSCACKSPNANPTAKCAPGVCINEFAGDNCDYKFDITSLKFNANGDKLTATVYSTLKRPIPCDQVFQDASKLGERSQCVFNTDKNTLEVILGPGASISSTDVLKALNYPGSKDTNNVQVNSGDFIAAAPTVSLVGDKSVVSTCDDLFLNAYGSVSLDRRPLTFAWSVASGPSSSDEAALSAVIASETRGGLRLKFKELTLGAGTYIVSVTVTSSFGKSDTKSFSFTLIANAIPSVFIKQGAESKFMIGSVSTISPIIKFPTCYGGNGQVQYTYSLDASQSKASVTPSTKNDMLVLGKGFTEINQEGDYYFTVTATANGADPASTSFKITAIAQPLILSFNIDNIIQSVHDPIAFELSTVDPSKTTDALNESITCYDLTNGQDCAIQPGYVNKFTSDQFTAGAYQFTATVTKGSRVATRYLFITLLDQAKDTLLKVSINSNVDLSVVDPSKDLFLTYTAWGAVLANPTFTWTPENFALDSNTTTTSSYLKIPSSLLSPGDSYTVSLVVKDGEKEGSAIVSFTVNSPPTQGQFDVYPTSGKALSDVFDIKCGNGWSDPQTPLTYQFMFYDNVGKKWNPLTDRTEVASASLSLPQPTSGTVLTVKAVVYDALGASSYATFDVTINKPSAEESVSALSSMATSKGTVTLSAASSAMSVIGAVNSSQLNSTQIDAIKQAASAIADAFLAQQASTESVSVSKTSAENGLSFASSFSSSVSSGMVSDSTTQKVVSKLADTTGSINSNNIEIGNEMIDNVKKSADNFLDVIQKGQPKTRAFSKVDLSNINTVYTNLATLSVKDTIADLPSTVVAAGGVTTLTRKVNIATLNSLSEKISGNNKIKLSAKFAQLSQIVNLKTINIMAKVIDAVSGANNTITKAIDFKLVDTNTINISNASAIADLVFERTKNARSLMATVNTCMVLNTQTNLYEVASGCTLTTNNDGTITASVSSTGTYIISSITTTEPGSSTNTPTPTPSKPVTPTKSTKISATSTVAANILILILAALFAVLMM